MVGFCSIVDDAQRYFTWHFDLETALIWANSARFALVDRCTFRHYSEDFKRLVHLTRKGATP